MFAKTIIDSDAFLDMPLTTQVLYFHLSMRADDDGFINNPRKIQRMIGSSDDDLKLLVAKRFIIPFDTGVCVIKHWRIHNYIRGDRKKDTVYHKEMDSLEIKENGAYSLITTRTVDVPMIEATGETARQKAYAESSLPYSFEYKIKREFYGKPCPVCGAKMGPAVEDGIVTENRIPSVQHNTPISKGGKHELGNISIVCLQCNVTLRDTPTGSLNADEVIEVWDRMSGNCLPTACQLPANCPTEDRLGKDSIGKVSIEEERIEEPAKNLPSLPAPSESSKTIPYEEVQNLYNSICKSFPKCTVMSNNRKRAIKARFSSGYKLEHFKTVFEKAEASSFMKGKNDRGWRATFDWMIADSSMAKVLDGNYDDNKGGKNNAGNDEHSGSDAENARYGSWI
jgi:uncharacterized phage protein (TIGR02220 family)